MLRNIFLMGLTTLFFACVASQMNKTPNVELNQMMAQKSFEIAVRTAEPQITQAMAQVANSGMLPPGSSVSRIDVSAQGYFIKVHGDSVSAHLPYYGERQMGGGGYNLDTGIKFSNLAENFEMEKDEAKQNYKIRFRVNSGTENYFVNLEIGNKGSSTSNIQSSHRNRIRYSGKVQPIDEPTEDSEK